MKVVIVGASYTGIQLARTLADEKSDVVLIDNSPEKVNLARNKIDCTVIQAAGNDIQVLERDAGISSADALVMLTEDDETNMVTCSLVDMRYPDLLKIARVRNETYYDVVGFRGRGADTFVEWIIKCMDNKEEMSLFTDFYTSSILQKYQLRVL